jgi:hypothetical protein
VSRSAGVSCWHRWAELRFFEFKQRGARFLTVQDTPPSQEANTQKKAVEVTQLDAE